MIDLSTFLGYILVGYFLAYLLGYIVTGIFSLFRDIR